jgi:hypothetical protein
MLDKFLYKFFGSVDNIFSYLESYSIRLTEYFWHTRVKLLKKKRRKNGKEKKLQNL